MSSKPTTHHADAAEQHEHDEAAPSPIEALMASLIDYAGLFPPAKLSMAEAVRNYAKYLRDDDAWMLGRFIVPVSRLGEFKKEVAAQKLLPTHEPEDESAMQPHEQPWPISALIDVGGGGTGGGKGLDEQLDAIFAFNAEHGEAANGLAIIDAVEIKCPPDRSSGKDVVAFIDETLDLLPEELFPFFEMPSGGSGGVDPRGFAAALSGSDAGAKIRTGGVTPELIPPVSEVAAFIEACAAAEVPFKATAGLHHPLRAEYPLTYEANAPRGVMHGYLNVFVAAMLVREGRGRFTKTEQVLAETDPKAFKFTPTSLEWRGCRVDAEDVLDARVSFSLSYGSCSFDEPRDELRKLGLLKNS